MTLNITHVRFYYNIGYLVPKASTYRGKYVIFCSAAIACIKFDKVKIQAKIKEIC